MPLFRARVIFDLRGRAFVPPQPQTGDQVMSQPVDDNNRHIKEYLSRYINLPHSPHFAVMLTGPWGIGKTFLVKRFLKEALHEDQNYVYVSLYGLASPAEIDAALFRAIYPVLDSKGVRIAGHVAKTAMRFFRIDSEIKLVDLISKFNASLYVFDDLERCDMETNKVLGYINDFVEHDGCKVLIIANEAEIKKEQDYSRRREKLIGRTLEVQSALDDAFSHFLTKVDEEKTREFLKARRSDIFTVYQHAAVNNLRILQQTMWEFGPLLCALSEEQRANAEGMGALLKLFFALSFEFKAGRIGSGDLTDRVQKIVAGKMKEGKSQEPTPLAEAAKRYPEQHLHDPILSDQLLVDLLVKGIVDEEQIRTSVGRSSYFVNVAGEPPWRTVWHWIERTDEEFSQALAKMERQFVDREVTEPGEILHIFGNRLWLADEHLIDASREDVVAQGKRYIDDLYEQKRLEPQGDGELRPNGYGGLGINENKTPEYLDLFDYMQSKQLKATEDSYPNHGVNLLREMESDPELFYRRLNYTASDDNIFARKPVLAAIDPDVFVASLLKLPPIAQRTVLTAFKGRYGSGMLSHELAAEKTWLAAVRDSLLKAADSLSKIGKLRASTIAEWYLNKYID